MKVWEILIIFNPSLPHASEQENSKVWLNFKGDIDNKTKYRSSSRKAYMPIDSITQINQNIPSNNNLSNKRIREIYSSERVNQDFLWSLLTENTGKLQMKPSRILTPLMLNFNQNYE